MDLKSTIIFALTLSYFFPITGHRHCDHRGEATHRGIDPEAHYN